MLRYTMSSGASIGHPELTLARPDGSASLAAQHFPSIVQIVPPSRGWPKPAVTAPNSLVTRLSAFVRLNGEERDALAMLSSNAKPFRADQILVHEGSSSNSVYLILSGLACRYKMLAGGRRQILGYLIPGDLCDIHFVIANRPDHSVALVGDSSVARIPTWRIAELIARYPNIGRALTLAALIDAVILREWLLSVGQRDALQRLSHFFCEMAVRLEAIGGTNADGSFELPVNQITLADTLGLTPVHINRTLQRLRNDGLIRLCHRRLAILDRDRLAMIAGFDDSYLRVRPVAD